VTGGLAGLLSGAAAVAASEAVASLLHGVTSPFFSVGDRAVDAAPRPVKEWAINTFGTHDKPVLVGGVALAVAVLAIIAGVLGVRRPRLAVAVFLALSAVATAAAVTDRAATSPILPRLLPAVALVVVGLGSLVVLLRALRTPDTAVAAAPAATTAAPRVQTVESVEHGKQRMLVRDLLPAHVEGDDLPAAFDRRAFMKAALVVGAIAAAGGVTSRVFGGNDAAASRVALKLPSAQQPAPPIPSGAMLDVKGITPYLTSNTSFYRVDTALEVPAVPIEGWTLRIHGMVDKELQLTYADLLKRRLVEERVTLTCVSNPVGGGYLGNAAWLGVPLRDLLLEAGVQPGADAVKSTSVDDFTVGTPLPVLMDKGRGALLAIGMNGAPLPLEHGFPARMVVPGLYGYVSATKWVIDLEVTRFADFTAYWTSRGYAAQAPIKTSSRIDVPRSFAQVSAGLTPVAGVAWAQDRGIAKVEVRVDGGAWQQADLAAEDTINTWRQWVWHWDAKPGNHTLEVRSTDKSGYTQTTALAPIAPDGATGLDSVSVSVS
jgi:DMSO/TMAO reductase YedYZ molybdopterin-dependent catalytic subunit